MPYEWVPLIEWIKQLLLGNWKGALMGLWGMNWTSITESALANILAAVVIAAVAWLISWIRNHRLEKRLAESLSPNGIGTGFDPRTGIATFTLQVHNYADATIRIRSIVFIADKFHIELHPAKDHTIFQTPLSNEILAPRFSKRILSKGPLEDDGNPNAMLLPPKTMGIWEVDPQIIGNREWKIAKVYLAFEYATLFGNAALVRVEPNEQSVKSIRETFEPLSRALYSGKQADVLSLFRQPVQAA